MNAGESAFEGEAVPDPASVHVSAAEPITNPGLIAALSTFHAAPTPERQQWLTVQMSVARYLLPIRIEGSAIAPGTQLTRASIPAGNSIGLVLMPDDQQRPLLPVFSHGDAFRPLAAQGCVALIIGAHELWALALALTHSQEQLQGVAIDPDGPGWALDRTALEWLHANGSTLAPLATNQPP